MVTVAESRAFLEAKHRQRGELRLRLWEEASSDADRIIEHIAKKHGARRIWQWGSILKPENFSEISDIDIAVEGILDAGSYFQMLGEIMPMTRFQVDLVQMEKIEPEFAALIRAKGKVVHER